MSDFLNTYFGWLASLSNPLYYFAENYGEINNPIISMIKTFVMIPFLVFVTFLPLYWILKIFYWSIEVMSNSIK